MPPLQPPRLRTYKQSFPLPFEMISLTAPATFANKCCGDSNRVTSGAPSSTRLRDKDSQKDGQRGVGGNSFGGNEEPHFPGNPPRTGIRGVQQEKDIQSAAR